ncbi:MarR family winged helix-turn-helix transcriptional regulator [Phytohabitans flavus]|uniref:MarR family winged helix-turn-helix transcriptional regulator n=1 Tax=Phytohabitans flavus TaxID=1076124 RepID=UPI0018D62450|nr:MarR family transcriptional regulator [Phytohabitans flavus]
MTPSPDREAVGTLMRHVLELLDGDVAAVYRDAGLPEYRPRFSPPIRALVAAGPMTIRDLATAVGVTHSAASQTVAQLTRAGLVELSPGTDARQRIVTLTGRARELLPVIEAEWAATAAAMRELDAELPMPLAGLLRAVEAALRDRPFRERIQACLPDPPQAALENS